jgi:hypothetical protein
MARAYTFNLSSSSITALIKSLEYEKKRTFKTMSALCKVLTAEGHKVAKLQIDAGAGGVSGINLDKNTINDTRNLRRSIGKTVVPRITFIKGTIYADMPGKYVEYGWGIRGADSPHPDFNGNPWGYDIGGKGLTGVMSRPFMYNTGKHIRNVSTQRALEVFGKK